MRLLQFIINQKVSSVTGRRPTAQWPAHNFGRGHAPLGPHWLRLCCSACDLQTMTTAKYFVVSFSRFYLKPSKKYCKSLNFQKISESAAVRFKTVNSPLTGPGELEIRFVPSVRRYIGLAKSLTSRHLRMRRVILQVMHFASGASSLWYQMSW